MSNDQSLLDRVEMPSIPEAAMKKIAILEEQFSRAEVEQCMFLIPSSLSLCLFCYGGASKTACRVYSTTGTRQWH